MADKQKEVSYPFAMITSCIATILSSTLFDELDKHLHDDNFIRAYKNMRLTKGAYKAWIDRIFNSDKFSKTKNDDMRMIQTKCNEIVDKLKADTMLFKHTIANYMLSDDIVYENTLSIMVVCCSLLNLAVKVCDYVDTTKLSEAYLRTLEIIKPKQLYKNIKDIYDYLPMPDDFDLEKSEDVVRCMDIITDKIGEYFDKEFCQ